MTSVWFWSKLWYSWMWSKLLNLEQIWLVKILVFLILEQIWLVKIYTLEDSTKLQDLWVFLSYEEVDLGICLLSGTAPMYWSRDQSTELQKSKVSNHQPSRQTTEDSELKVDLRYEVCLSINDSNLMTDLTNVSPCFKSGFFCFKIKYVELEQGQISTTHVSPFHGKKTCPPCQMVLSSFM